MNEIALYEQILKIVKNLRYSPKWIQITLNCITLEREIKCRAVDQNGKEHDIFFEINEIEDDLTSAWEE